MDTSSLPAFSALTSDLPPLSRLPLSYCKPCPSQDSHHQTTLRNFFSNDAATLYLSNMDCKSIFVVFITQFLLAWQVSKSTHHPLLRFSHSSTLCVPGHAIMVGWKYSSIYYFNACTVHILMFLLQPTSAQLISQQ